MTDEIFPLLFKVLFEDIGVVAYSLAYVSGKAGDIVGPRTCQLVGEGGEEFRSVGQITPTFRKEEACPKSPLEVPLVSDRTRNGGLSGASHAIQPEDACIVGIIRPAHNVVKEVYSGVV